nr:hypothetical protein [Marinobacter sp. DS40M8]
MENELAVTEENTLWIPGGAGGVEGGGNAVFVEVREVERCTGLGKQLFVFAE